jgi:hypothetical protein
MPRWLKIGLIATVALIVVIQLVPKKVSNPAVKARGG